MPGPFEIAKDPAKTAAAARQAFEKLGDTRFELASLELRNPDGLFVPVSQWNALRRQVTDALEARRTDAIAGRLSRFAARWRRKAELLVLSWPEERTRRRASLQAGVSRWMTRPAWT